ncbi:hypothetical protein QY95_03979 [Bacillus thermotolerans]|uniref:Uncharacterized protein n=1 Tax=Bacillus thermotolerans TaxID=1221996 RepID=A0A0F5HM73_BACTR|nr:hypothetical protein QY95_03979 [Bacillus thermotolerans]
MGRRQMVKPLKVSVLPFGIICTASFKEHCLSCIFFRSFLLLKLIDL